MRWCNECMEIRCSHSLRDEAGFSLIEVLVAMALLGVSASVLVGTQIAAVRSCLLYTSDAADE